MKNLFQKLCLGAMFFTTLYASGQAGPKLSSLPSAGPTIFLDFDGQSVYSVWNNYVPFYCDPSGLSDADITYVFNIVSEDYRPFAINVTTDSTKFLDAPMDKRIRIIVTPTSAWYPGVGGIGYTTSFTWGQDLPCFVFTNRLGGILRNIAEASTHESGHSLGLKHQSKYDQGCSLLENYNSGTGINNTETSWAPVMGKSYNKNITGWNDGPTPANCATVQDNLSTITTTNGFTYRDDDYAETLDNNTTLLNPLSFNATGIITTPTDKDAFRFVNTSLSPIHISAKPYSVGANNEGADLDILVQLYNSSSTLIRTYNVENSMSINFDTTLALGTYYLVIDGTGNNNASNYGSLGAYSISGSRDVLAIHNVTLNGNSDGKTHKLQWQTISDEPIVKQVIESSADGRNFSAIFTDINGINNFSTVANAKGNILYRLKATSSIGESMYSNIIVLKANNDSKAFNVSTLVKDNIRVIATEDYQYKLYDANARLIVQGNNKKGINIIDVNNIISGIYVLQMIYKNNSQIERILKQ